MKTPNVPQTQRRPKVALFRKTRGGIPLTRDEVKEIKAGRKKIRKEMKAYGIYSKDEFEATASSLGLYFDKRRGYLLPLLLGDGKWLWLLLGLGVTMIVTLLAMSMVTQMRGYFTINMSDHLFKLGFVLSETEDFEKPATSLFAEPAADVPCISITDIPADVGSYDGQHDGFGYFAYTYYLRNEGDSTVDYRWQLLISGESRNVSSAAWVMVFEDDVLQLYAKMNDDGDPQMVPDEEDNTRGYLDIPVLSMADDPSEFLEPVKTVGDTTYNRVITIPFEDEDTVASGYMTAVEPEEVHKYTVVVWLEGDDPDCTDDLIGGHIGLNMQYNLITEEEDSESFWERLADALIFWDDE